MKYIFTILLIIAICLGCTNMSDIPQKLEYIDLFTSKSDTDRSCYRIPSLIKTKNGNLIAAIDERNNSCGDLRANNDINIVIRTSQDDGYTWSDIKPIIDYPLGESASDPSMILDESTDEIFLFFNYMNLIDTPNRYYLQLVTSNDNGISWSTPVDITNQISKSEWRDDFKFITSGRGIQSEDGTLLHTLVNIQKGLHVFGSRDHGQHWFLIDKPIVPGDESKIIELDNGDWMMNSRVNKSGLRYIHKSKDHGMTWDSSADSTLVDPSCNASLIRYTSIKNGFAKSRILFSNLSSDSARENLSLKISYDEGETWKYSKSIYAGSSAYSSLCILDNGDIGIFFEKDDYKKNVFVRVTLDWLTDGNDSLKKSE